MFSFNFESTTRVVTLKVEGFWTLSTLAAFSIKALTFFARIRSTSGDFATIIDAREFPVQAGKIATGLGLIAQKGAMITTGPVAIVVAATLNKLQIDRIMATSQFHTFTKWDEAMNWVNQEWKLSRHFS